MAARPGSPDVIDDHTPTPAHARVTWKRLWMVLMVCLGLWAAVMGGLTAASGGLFIESAHGKLQFTAPLVGITATVVGVIVNLAVLFNGGIDGWRSAGQPLMAKPT